MEYKFESRKQIVAMPSQAELEKERNPNSKLTDIFSSANTLRLI
jgi:hypothetical protein